MDKVLGQIINLAGGRVVNPKKVEYFFIEAHLPRKGWTVTGATLHKVEMYGVEDKTQRWEEFRKTSGCYNYGSSSWRGDFATTEAAREYGESWEFPPFTLCPKCFAEDVGEEATDG